MTLRPRNTLVTVVEIKDAERKSGSGIVIPSRLDKEYVQCEVVAVGDGNVSLPDEQSQCRDLAPGQTVLVKVARSIRVSVTHAGIEPIGMEFTDDQNRPLRLVEQTQIVAIMDPDLSLTA